MTHTGTRNPIYILPFRYRAFDNSLCTVRLARITATAFGFARALIGTSCFWFAAFDAFGTFDSYEILIVSFVLQNRMVLTLLVLHLGPHRGSSYLLRTVPYMYTKTRDMPSQPTPAHSHHHERGNTTFKTIIELL